MNHYDEPEIVISAQVQDKDFNLAQYKRNPAYITLSIHNLVIGCWLSTIRICYLKMKNKQSFFTRGIW